MSTCEFSSATARPGARTALAARVAGSVAAFFRAWRNRRAFSSLAELTDAELADIGLTRADLAAAVEVPFGADPTAKLRALASRRAATAADLTRSVG